MFRIRNRIGSAFNGRLGPGKKAAKRQIITGKQKSRDAPDTDFAGYSANLKAGLRMSGQISGAGRIPDIRPDLQLNLQKSSKI
jgi:hypothetical protein